MIRNGVLNGYPFVEAYASWTRFADRILVVDGESTDGTDRVLADLAGLVVLAIVYWPLPMLMFGAGLSQFLPAVVPFAVTNAMAIAWPAAEVVAIAVLLHLRWRQATRIEIVADDREEPSIGGR